MREEQKYRTSAGMRTALEERLNRFAKEKGRDIMRLRRQVAFDRLLSRLFAGQTGELIMKGGYALELRLKHARTTKDVDISFKGNLRGLWRDKDASSPAALQDYLQQFASMDQGDHFEFIIGKAILDLENAPYGGCRFPVEARMAGRVFIKFAIDVAAGDAWMEPHDKLFPYNWLEFAGIAATEIPVINIEQQFAEKLHSYTMPRKTKNSRVKDLVDLVLMIEESKMNNERLHQAVIQTFEKRKIHELPSELPEPPDTWKIPFKKMAEECGITSEINMAIDKVRKFYSDSFHLGGRK
jgi:predicted nucleotidyltransferase component of viral defense system